MKKWMLFCAVVLSGLLIGNLAAKMGEVQLKDGRFAFGDITEKDSGYVVTVNDSAATYTKSDVKSVEYFDTLEEGYKQKREKITATDATGLPALRELAKWVMKEKEAHRNDPTVLNDELGEVAKSILAVAPGDLQGLSLQKVYEKNRVIVDHGGRSSQPDQGQGSRGGTLGGTSVTTGGATGVPTTQTGVLSAKDVIVIKLTEMQRDEKVPMSWKTPLKDTLDEVWAGIQGQDAETNGKPAQDRFKAMDGPTQLAFVLSKTSPDNYWRLADKIKEMRKDPVALDVWRNTVNPWVKKYCGSDACHGGANAPAFHLLGKPMTDEELYTNFYVISEFTAKSGDRMLDRDNPDSSLLLRYALPPSLAGVQHPKVAGATEVIPVVFRSTDDRVYQIIKNWLSVRPSGLRSGMDRLPYHVEMTGAPVVPPKPPTPTVAPPSAPPPSVSPGTSTTPPPPSGGGGTTPMPPARNPGNGPGLAPPPPH